MLNKYLCTNYNFFIPKLFKINTIKTLIHRCYNLSSNWKVFHTEINFLQNFFQNNGYPKWIIENCIYKFINKLFCPSDSKTTNNKVTYLKLPFYGHLSYKLRKNLDLFLKPHFPGIDFKFIFVNPFTIKSFFRTKDKIPSELTPNIVYQYTCSTCKSGYIGKTTRILAIRIAEHKGVSHRSGLKITHPSHSPIRNHCIESGHEFLNENFKILLKANHAGDTKIFESLLIHQLKPQLNYQTTSHPLMIL